MLISRAWRLPLGSPAVALAWALPPATRPTQQFWLCLARSLGAPPWRAWFWCDLWKWPAESSHSTSSKCHFAVLGFSAMPAAPSLSLFMQQLLGGVSGRLSWQTSSLLGLRNQTQSCRMLQRCYEVVTRTQVSAKMLNNLKVKYWNDAVMHFIQHLAEIAGLISNEKICNLRETAISNKV